ncbi:uncharacterized protein LOC144306849 [Canis aureus]
MTAGRPLRSPGPLGELWVLLPAPPRLARPQAAARARLLWRLREQRACFWIRSGRSPRPGRLPFPGLRPRFSQRLAGCRCARFTPALGTMLPLVWDIITWHPHATRLRISCIFEPS